MSKQALTCGVNTAKKPLIPVSSTTSAQDGNRCHSSYMYTPQCKAIRCVHSEPTFSVWNAQRLNFVVILPRHLNMYYTWTSE